MEEVLSDIKMNLKVPFVHGYITTFGDVNRPSLMLTISLDKKSTWGNGYLENSKYGKFHIENNGIMTMISGDYNLKPWMRKTRYKNKNEIVTKLNKYISKVKK